MTRTRAKKRTNQVIFPSFFVRHLSAEKKKVFLDVAKKASKEQLEMMQSVRIAHQG